MAGRGGVALIEDEIDDLEHQGQPGRERVPARDLEGGTRLGQGPFRPHDALRNGRLRHQECAGDLVGRQATEQAERERDPRLGREHRMTGYEHETQEIIADVIVECGIGIRHGDRVLGLDRAAELRLLALEQGSPAQKIDGPVLGGGHEPGARIVRDARLWPALERDQQSVLGKLLGKTDVAHDPHEAGNEPRRLDSPDRIDGAMCIGSRHGCRYTIFSPSAQAHDALALVSARRASG